MFRDEARTLKEDLNADSMHLLALANYTLIKLITLNHDNVNKIPKLLNIVINYAQNQNLQTSNKGLDISVCEKERLKQILLTDQKQHLHTVAMNIILFLARHRVITLGSGGQAKNFEWNKDVLQVLQ